MYWWGWGFWPLIPIFWIGMIAFLCWGMSHWFGQRSRPNAVNAGYRPANTPIEPAEPSALEILRRRYARGEIDILTFDQMCERLERSALERAPYPYE